jgi:hypothetical protein
MTPEQQIERQDKIVAGLKTAYTRMLEFKRYNKSEVVVTREGKIVRVKP